jgi:glycosyltransferase involved in cell wall biosynthesis
VPRRVSSEAWARIPRDAFVVYSIAPWTARKALGDVVRAYQSACAGRSDTLLVLKTSPRDFTDTRPQTPGPVAPGTTAWTLARLLAEFDAPAPVRLVTVVLSDHDIDALHTRGDCYLSLCRSEGWGNPPFDAATWGNPVVITGFGGPLEYLDAESAFLIDYELVPVDDPAGGASYTPDQHWALPSVEHAATQLRRVLADPGEARARTARARDHILREFAPPAVAQAFLAALDGLSQTART